MITQDDIDLVRLLSKEYKEAKEKYQKKRNEIIDRLINKEEVEFGTYTLCLKPNIRVSWKEYMMRKLGIDTDIERKSIEEKAKALTRLALKEKGVSGPQKLIITRRD